MRVLGLLLIIGACLGYYLATSHSHWRQNVLADAPLSLTQATQVAFTARDAISYQVGIVVFDAGKPGNKERDRELTLDCVVRSGSRVIPARSYRGYTYDKDGQTTVIYSFRGESEKTYTVRVIPRNGTTFIGHSPRLRVIYGQYEQYTDLVSNLISLLFYGFWGLVGLWFTFVSRKW